VNDDIESLRHFLTVTPGHSVVTKMPVLSEEHHLKDDKMTLVMLAARRGQMLLVFLCNNAVDICCSTVVCIVHVLHCYVV